MLFKAKALTNFKMECRNGLFGRVEQFYFDDMHWAVRYLVADVATWLPGRSVLISPYSLGAASRDRRTIYVNLTKKQIEDSPDPDSDKPVSQQFEAAHSDHFGWPAYWGGPFMWGAYNYVEQNQQKWVRPRLDGPLWDYHLRSTNEVDGYGIEAKDGRVGHVDDFILDDQTWAIRYLVVDAGHWWAGAKVLIAPQWIEQVSWGDSKVTVNLTRDAIRAAPRCDEVDLLTRNYEEQLHKHYERLGYWMHQAPAGRR